MKRSENVGLVLMGAAAFAATFAGGMAYSAWQKPSHAAQAQGIADQQCITRSDGTQDCQPRRRGFAYYLVPTYFQGWSWGGSAAKPVTREAAFAGNSRSTTAPLSHTGVERSGFGSTARSPSIRVSAGG